MVSWAKNDKSTFLVRLNETQTSFETNKEIVCGNKVILHLLVESAIYLDKNLHVKKNKVIFAVLIKLIKKWKDYF